LIFPEAEQLSGCVVQRPTWFCQRGCQHDNDAQLSVNVLPSLKVA